jgi:hypothetical protein
MLYLTGGIKQCGNIATALWSVPAPNAQEFVADHFCRAFVLALHLFNLLFLRTQSTVLEFWCTIVCGWSIVAFIILIGPTVIQTPEKGPYYGVSGAW